MMSHANRERSLLQSDRMLQKSVGLLNAKCRASEELRRQSIVKRTFESFLEDEFVRGSQGLAGFLADTHKKAEESESIEMRRRWAEFLRKFMLDFDQHTKDAIEMEMSPEELHIQMMSGLVEMIRSDPDFAQAIIAEAASCVLSSRSTTTTDDLISAIESVNADDDNDELENICDEVEIEHDEEP